MKTLSSLAVSVLASFAAFAGDLYVSTNDIHTVEGSDLGWGTYMTDDGENHNAYTNLQQAVNAAEKNDTVWVEDGFVCDDSNGFVYSSKSKHNVRLSIPRAMTVRSRSGSWEGGATIKGRWDCDVSGGTAYIGPNALAGVCAEAGSVMLIGFRIERCSNISGNSDAHGFSGNNFSTISNCFVSECYGSYTTLKQTAIRDCVISNCWGGTYGGITRECSMYDTLVVDYAKNNSGSTMSDSALQVGSGNVISNCTFRNCYGRPWLVSALKSSGGRLIGCKFFNNGAAVCVGMSYGTTNGRLDLENCVFSGNTGTCIGITTGSGSTMAVRNCVFTNNFGGVVSAAGSYVNCLFADNTLGGPLVTPGGQGGTVGIYNCTIYGNTQTGNFGTLGANVKAVNTIVRNNTLKAGYTDSFAAATNCCIEATASVSEGKDNTTDEPRLVSPAAGIYSPSELSSCYETGSLTAYELPATDLAGRSRTMDGKVSIGAFEYDPTKRSFVGSQTLPTYLYPPATVTFSADVAGFGFAPVFYWDFDGDGVADEVTMVPTLTHAFDVGHWPVMLSVSNLTLKTGSTLAYEPFSVTPRPVRYVKLGNEETAAEPYDTEENAAADIQVALNYCADGDEVVILPGTYPIPQPVVVSKDLIVHGSTGNPADVVISGSSACRCLNVRGAANTIVHSLTLANGLSNAGMMFGGGVLIGTETIAPNGNITTTAGAGILSNAVVRNCRASAKFGGTAGVAAFGPEAFVTHCVISNNNASVCTIDGGRASAVGLSVTGGARAENCLVVGNYTPTTYAASGLDPNANVWDETGKWKGTYWSGFFQAPVCIGANSAIRFCTIVGNKTSFCGGVNLSDVTARFSECVIAGNTVSSRDVRELPNGERYRIWSAFLNVENDGRLYFKFNYKDTDEGRRSFLNVCAAEQALVDSGAYAVGQTSNAIDVAGVTLGEGTIVAPTEKLVRNLARGRYDLPAGSPAIDVVPADAASAMATKDLIGNRRLFCGAYDLGAFEKQQRGTMILVR